MTPETIIDQADRRTERRGPKVLDLKTEFCSVLTDFCSRHRFHWRRLSYAFNTVANTPDYDFSSADVIGSGFVEGVVPEKFLKDGVKVISTTSSSTLSPIFEPHVQDMILQDSSTGAPIAFFVEPGSTSSFRPVPIPDGVYTIRSSFWALPALTADQLPSTVPLVPVFLHHLLVKGLEAQILRYLIGEGSAKYVSANAEYEAGILRSAGAIDFADGRVIDYRDRGTDAVQSTSGGEWRSVRNFGGSSSSSSSSSEASPMTRYSLSGALDGVNVIFTATDTIPANHLLFGDGNKLVRNDPDGYTLVGNTITCAHPPRTLELYY